MDKVLSDIVLPFVEYFEGCKLTAYLDSAQVPTIGIGHTKGVKLGMVIDRPTAIAYFMEDVESAVERVKSLVSIPLTDDELGALISQAYNLKSFPQLAAHLKESKLIYKQKTLLYCNDVAGHKLNGLLIRRISERLLFESRDWQHVADDLRTKNLLSYSIHQMGLLFSGPNSGE
jgi:lysozyme